MSRPEKINVWYLDDNHDYLNRFKERHNKHFSTTPFNNVVELLERLRKIKYGDECFPDILLVDLYAPLSKFEVNLNLLDETNKRLKEFFQMEKKLKTYVDSAWEPYGVEIVDSVREHYSNEELPIAIYTQRGLVLLEDEFIIELEKLGISWLLKKQFSAETDRLILSKIMMQGKRGMEPGQKRILILDDNPKFIEEFIKRHKGYYDIEGIIDQGELLASIEKMKLENRFPNVLLVDLYYPRGNDRESMLKIKEANEKLLEFHNFEAELKNLIKKTYEPVGIQVIKAVREMYNEAQLPIMIYSQSGLLMLDNSSIQKITHLDTGWLLKDRYSICAEQIKIINQITKSNKRKKTAYLLSCG
jgi:CheY-like chemotaxis protein